MRAELTGRREERVAIVTVKRLSGRSDVGRARLEPGASRRDGVRVETLDGDDWVTFDRRSSGSDGDRTAADTTGAAASMLRRMNFIVTFDNNVGALQLFLLAVYLRWYSWHCWQRSQLK